MNGSPCICTRGGVSKLLSRPRRCKSHWEKVSFKRIPLFTPMTFALDIEYFRTKLFTALKIPKEYMTRMP